MKTKTIACCLLSIAIAMIAGGATAQATRALPRMLTDGFAGGTNFSIPPTAFRAQYWFAGDNLPINSAVTALGIRIARNTAVGASSRTVGIEVANAATSFASYSATFAQNLGSFSTTFFASRTVNFPASSPSNDPNVAAAWFPGDAPFPFFGPHFVVDFRGGASSGSAVVPNDGFVAIPGGATHVAGRAGCGGLLQAAWQANTLTLTASGLPPSVAIAFNLGFENVAVGGVGLPVDLAIIGMPGCDLGVIPVASGQATTGPSGQATLSLPVALSSIVTPTITSQVVHPRIPNPQGVQDFATTNAVTSALGFAGACNALFAGSDTATTATQGPQLINNSIVLLVR